MKLPISFGGQPTSVRAPTEQRDSHRYECEKEQKHPRPVPTAKTSVVLSQYTLHHGLTQFLAVGQNFLESPN